MFLLNIITAADNDEINKEPARITLGMNIKPNKRSSYSLKTFNCT